MTDSLTQCIAPKGKNYGNYSNRGDFSSAASPNIPLVDRGRCHTPSRHCCSGPTGTCASTPLTRMACRLTRSRPPSKKLMRGYLGLDFLGRLLLR